MGEGDRLSLTRLPHAEHRMKRRPANLKKVTKEVKKATKQPVPKQDTISFDHVFSTGSTLLDLAISGGRVNGGGIPAGIIVEIFGPSSSGKTSILAELAASIQENGGQVKFLDPEARLDQEYCEIYGFSLQEKDYHMPDTVNEMFGHIWDWQPDSTLVTNLVAADSLAALSTEMEMEDEDKMGMKRAKDFSQGLRKTCRIIKKKNLILACSNQERGGTGGTVTSGGKGIPYYASLRIRIYPDFKNTKIKKTKTIGKKPVEKIVGVRSICEIKKSSIDSPYRTAPVSIIFGYGIDTIRDELQFHKDLTGAEKFECFGRKFGTIQTAIKNIGERQLQEDLRQRTITLWNGVQEQFKTERQKKRRY